MYIALHNHANSRIVNVSLFSFFLLLCRACPECRTKSDFVTPSRYWVEDKGEKMQLIQGYKSALRWELCAHFECV